MLYRWRRCAFGGGAMTAKLPAFQFYPGDWRKDPNLRRCSHAARGVWMDVLCLMFDCEERGILISDGKPWTHEDAAAAVGGDQKAALACITELLGKGVAKLDKRGAIFSARMVRDEATRIANTSRVKRWRNGGCNASVTPEQRCRSPSVAPPSSSSDLSSDLSPPSPPKGGDGFVNPWNKRVAG